MKDEIKKPSTMADLAALPQRKGESNLQYGLRLHKELRR